MKMYLLHLFKILDDQNKNWRRNTVIMLDNATYHKCQSVFEIFENNNVAVLFTGPHSYDASPCELYFATFKAADINPRHVATGKK